MHRFQPLFLIINCQLSTIRQVCFPNLRLRPHRSRNRAEAMSHKRVFWFART